MKILFNKAKNDQWDESEVAMSVIARFGTGGNNMPIVVDDDIPENNRSADGEQPSGKLLRTGCVQRYVGGGE